jgi:hypothetical protein
MDNMKIGHMPERDGGGGLVKRKSRRVRIPGFVADLADGNAIIGGKIGNISKTGFNFTDVSPDFHADKHVYTIVLSRGGSHFRVMAKPCWRRQKGKEATEIGFKILDAPWEWVEFTTTEVPEFDYVEPAAFRA